MEPKRFEPHISRVAQVMAQIECRCERCRMVGRTVAGCKNLTVEPYLVADGCAVDFSILENLDPKLLATDVLMGLIDWLWARYEAAS